MTKTTSEVFSSKRPTKSYIELGTISISRYSYFLMFPNPKSSEEILKEMKIEVGAIGGDALIDYRESGETNMVATIIKYN